MKAPPLFPRILEEYRVYLRSDDAPGLSLFSFCKQRHVNPNSMTQWMRRHGITTFDYFKSLIDAMAQMPLKKDPEALRNLLPDKWKAVPNEH